jgi:hypothetical protein
MKIQFGILLALFALCRAAQAQGFINLDFDSANISGYSPGPIPTQDAFPYWSAYYGPLSDPTYSGNVSVVAYDGISLGGAVISLVDPNAPAPYGPIQGNYSALLQGSNPTAGTAASIGQTGTIPSTAQSLIFWGNVAANFQVSFDGQMLSLVDVNNAMNYTVYGANCSAFAGQTGQLLFTAPVETFDLIDNIQFSSSSVPEPNILCLAAFTGAAFGWRRWRRCRRFSQPPGM